MLVNLKVPDETYEAYARRNPENPRLALEQTLLAYQDLDPRAAGLVLPAEELRELNTLLGHPISTPRELLEHVGRSQRCSFGEGLEVALSAGQRQRLQDMAGFWHEEPRAYAERTLRQAIIAVVGS